jgi:large subunit ribosomal protein L33
MAKKKMAVVRLVSMAGTGYFYTTRKNPMLQTKLLLRKYDPLIAEHTWFRVR